MAEGRQAIEGICFSASLTADPWPGQQAAAEGYAAGRGVCYLRLSPPIWAWPGGCGRGYAAGRRVCFLRLSPPTSGLAWRLRQRGAQLDGGLLSTMPLSSFRHGLEGAIDGRPMRLGVCFSSSFRVAHCLAWPGGDGEGAYRLRVCIHVPLAADFGPMEAWLEGVTGTTGS